jgi:8-oxo-dGTP pyrophosphatase MutT (NUDIX family)
MTRVFHGERIAKTARLRPGVTATIFGDQRKKVLLTKRSDNGQWCLPGGGLDPGESISEACIREIYEETGLSIQLLRLIGVYSSPDWVIEYADGNRFQILALNFEAEILGGSLTLNSEVTQFGYFSEDQIEKLDLLPHHRQRIMDAFSSENAPFIR